jgi:hypothetical protein
VTGLLVIIPVEGEPMLIVDALNDTEARHLDDWLAESLVLVRAPVGRSRGRRAGGGRVNEQLHKLPRETQAEAELREERERAGVEPPRLTTDRDARLWRAMMLAPSVEVCEALLLGEAVPLDRLDPEWVARFGGSP